jgi:hypothetical protein
MHSPFRVVLDYEAVRSALDTIELFTMILIKGCTRVHRVRGKWCVAACRLGLALAALASNGCGNDCEDLAEEARALKQKLAACREGDMCVIAASQKGDCTGELTCGFAVPSDKKSEAEREASRIGEQSLDCAQCVADDCVSPTMMIPRCDVVAGHCVIDFQ